MALIGVNQILKEFFGYFPVSERSSLPLDEFNRLPYDAQVRAGGLRGFSAELKHLSAEEKRELARLAAKELGYAQERVDFPLGEIIAAQAAE